MKRYDLYRCTREDGSAKDWAIARNPDGTVITRWGRTGQNLISSQTRRADMLALERAKACKGYIWIGQCEIDDLGIIHFPDTPDEAAASQNRNPCLTWQLSLGARVNPVSLVAWRQDVVELFRGLNLNWDADLLPDTTVSGEGRLPCRHVIPLLALLVLKQRMPPGVHLSLRTSTGITVNSDLRQGGDILELFETDLSSIRPLAISLGLLEPPIDLRMAILSERDHWF